MLDAYIIEQLRRREEERRRNERPMLELPLPLPPPGWPEKPRDEEDEPARVIIIDL